jgi:hypothetical protein
MIDMMMVVCGVMVKKIVSGCSCRASKRNPERASLFAVFHVNI